MESHKLTSGLWSRPVILAALGTFSLAQRRFAVPRHWPLNDWNMKYNRSSHYSEYVHTELLSLLHAFPLFWHSLRTTANTTHSILIRHPIQEKSTEVSNIFCSLFFLNNCGTFSMCRPGSSVGIATDYGLDGPGSNPGGDEIFRPPRPALGPTQPLVKWVPGLSRGKVRPWRGADHSPPSSAAVMEE